MRELIPARIGICILFILDIFKLSYRFLLSQLPSASISRSVAEAAEVQDDTAFIGMCVCVPKLHLVERCKIYDNQEAGSQLGIAKATKKMAISLHRCCAAVDVTVAFNL